MSDPTFKKKICLLGFFAVGKTSLVRQFIASTYDEKYHATIGVKVDSKIVNADGKDVQLMIWDVAGAEEYFTVPMDYVKGSSGYLLVLDSTRANTVERGLDIVRQINADLKPLPFVVLLNKIDLVDQFELTEEVLKPVTSLNCPVFRTSAKTGEGVQEAFLELARRMLAC